jgi:hypothetical protein
MSLLDRYRSGESEAVWSELMALGSGYHAILPEATAVADATMRQVLANLQTIRDRLAARGYIFANPAHVLSPLTPKDLADLEELESVLGPLPLSLRRFYEIVGTVNFMQDCDQCLHYSEEVPGEPWKIENLGRQDPLVVLPPGAFLGDCVGFREALRVGRIGRPEPGAVTVCFSPDEYHKANYSGGEDYGVALPCDAADFLIQGLYTADESFVQHLRLSLQGGGFRGATECDDESTELPGKPAPTGPLIEELVEGLAPI